MGANESWICQGRQYHGWFGSGTCDDHEYRRDDLGDSDDRIRAVAHGAVALLPNGLRTRFSKQLDSKGLARLAKLMAAWASGSRLDKTSFAERFFGRPSDDAVVDKLRKAAVGAEASKTHSDLRDVAANLATAVQTVGLDRWPRFLEDAEQRADAASPRSNRSEAPTNSQSSPSRLLKPKPGDRPPAEQLNEDEDAAPDRSRSPFTANGEPPILTAVPLLDDFGHPVVNRQGDPIMRPAGVDLHFFIKHGEALRRELEVQAPNEATSRELWNTLTSDLMAFGQSGAWDLQRLGGSYHREFVDVASVAIGLFGAALGMPETENLFWQNLYAKSFSHFGGVPMDSFYTHLPKTNVFNTRLGYELYRSGRISLRGHK